MICETCEKEFEPTTRQLKFCSKRCQEKCAQRKHYKEHPEKHREKRLKASENWEREAIYRIRSRAKKNGIPFDIDETDIQLVEFCPVLGIKLNKRHGNRGPIGYSATAPSVDRLVPSKGYIKGNVRVISARANLLKNDATVDELEKVIRYMKGVQID